ncbi:hypothetical protein DMC47_06465 [Nostoc sp. 3335mG]|nr:hypothetical protein DMC47_06465 [Nostoc sp. 3335mG]
MINALSGPISLVGSPLSLSAGQVSSQLKPDPKEEFLDYARMSPAERLRLQVLESMGISEEGLAAMDPESRSALEDEVSRRMMEALTGKDDVAPGSLVDVIA